MATRGLGKMARVGAVALAALATTPATAETLTDALIATYRNSGLLEQNRATLRAADEDVAQAISTLRPIIGYAADSTYLGTFRNDTFELQTTLSLSADLLLYDGGATRLAIDAAKEAVLITRDALRQIEQQVLLRGVSAYLNLRRAQAFVNLRRSNLTLIERELQAARDRFEVGEVTRTDVAIAEARRAGSQSALAASLGDQSQAEAEFLAAVGRAPGNLVPPPAPPATAATVSDAMAVARRTHPNIRSAMRQVTVAEINIARAEAALRPRVSAQARMAVDDDRQDRSSVGLNVTGPLYRGGQLTSLYRQSQARRDEARANLHLVRLDIDQDVANAWSQLLVANASLDNTAEQIRAATVAFRGVQEEATLGARTTLDVLNAEQELLDARASAISADTDRYVAVYALLSAMGLLTVDHLNLGIVTYDPAAYYNAVSNAPNVKVSPQGERLDELLRSLGRK